MIIYRAHHPKTDMTYIGKTAYSLNTRRTRHKYEAYKRLRNNKFHKALREFGFDTFEWSIFCTSDDRDFIRGLEKKLISNYMKRGKSLNTQVRNDR